MVSIFSVMIDVNELAVVIISEDDNAVVIIGLVESAFELIVADVINEEGVVVEEKVV